MVHSFDVDFATEYGLIEAILFNSFVLFLTLGDETTCYRDGRNWVRCSVKTLHNTFPYISDRSIQSALIFLETAGIIMVGTFNADKMDRTKWYALTDKGMLYV